MRLKELSKNTSLWIKGHSQEILGVTLLIGAAVIGASAKEQSIKRTIRKNDKIVLAMKDEPSKLYRNVVISDSDSEFLSKQGYNFNNIPKP